MEPNQVITVVAERYASKYWRNGHEKRPGINLMAHNGLSKWFSQIFWCFDYISKVLPANRLFSIITCWLSIDVDGRLERFESSTRSRPSLKSLHNLLTFSCDMAKSFRNILAVSAPKISIRKPNFPKKNRKINSWSFGKRKPKYITNNPIDTKFGTKYWAREG